MKIKIFKADLADMEAILQLQYTAYQSEAEINNNYEIQPLKQTLDELNDEFNKGIILKAVLDGKIIGSVRAYADGHTVYIGKLIVHPEHQGKGYGKRLLATVEGKLHRKRFELFTSGRSERNLKLYEKAGYKQFREETDESGITFVYLEKKHDDGTHIALGMCFGSAFGLLLGTVMDNIGLWMPIGIALGLSLGVSFGEASKNSKK